MGFAMKMSFSISFHATHAAYVYSMEQTEEQNGSCFELEQLSESTAPYLRLLIDFALPPLPQRTPCMGLIKHRNGFVWFGLGFFVVGCLVVLGFFFL